MIVNEISGLVVDLCVKIHKQYGPGLFESVYEEIFCYEWNKTKIPYLRQHPIPLVHEEIILQAGFRVDMIIDNLVLVEFKSIEGLAEVHFKQVLTYLKLTDLKLGLLINFNVALMKQGIFRLANNL
ncbi:MAG: GxxExxY protein [Chitinophagales bacterium]